MVLQRALGVVVAIVLALGAVFAFRNVGADSAPDTSATTTSTSSVTRASTAAPAQPTVTSGSVATTGPGLTEPGIHVVAQPDPEGILEVVEHVKLAKPVGGLSIALPRASGSGVAGTNPTISGFQAQADGLVVTDTPASPVPAGGDRLDLPTPATDITMRYRLEGEVSRSQPAPVGRVLIVLPPITKADLDLGDPFVVVEVVGASVRNLVCPNLPVSDQLCGRQNGRVWSTTPIPLTRSLAVAQVDLPQPGDR